MSSNYDNEAPGYTPATVMEEAARCLLCHDAPCSQDCPAGTDPGKFIRSIRFGNVRGAAETIRDNNALGAVCARVCPTEKYCQKGCSRSGIDRPIDIGGIQRYATDFETAADMKILEAGKSNGLSVASRLRPLLPVLAIPSQFLKKSRSRAAICVMESRNIACQTPWFPGR